MSSMSQHSKGLVGAIAIAWAAAAGIGEARAGEGDQIVKGTITLRDGNTIVGSPTTACRALLLDHDKSYKFLRALPRTTDNVRQWDCQYRDGDNVSTWGTIEATIKCPDGSSEYEWAYDRATCRCDGDLRASGGACRSEGEAPAAAVDPGATSPSSAKAMPENDPCFTMPPADPDQPRPEEAKCPLSARAFDIRRKLGANHVAIPSKFAIAVSEGTLKNGQKVRLVTTNQKKVFEALRAQSSTYLVPGERLDETAPDEKVQVPNKWKDNRHAEDYAATWLKANDVKTARDNVQMGSDPKACGGCTMMYKAHAWIHHERLDTGVVKANP